MTQEQAWTLSYASGGDLLAHLREQPGTLLLRTDAEAEPFSRLTLHFRYPDGELSASAEVLQILPSLGLVVQLEAAANLQQALADCPVSEAPEPPTIDTAPPPKGKQVKGAFIPKGSSVLSWPIEKLQADWHALNQGERIRLAKHGKRPARGLVLRSQDKLLQAFLLKNNGISADEIAAMAGMANLDPGVLRTIATSPEWVRHTTIARNLVSNPKLPMPLVQKVLGHLPIDEMRRLTKSGKVRASIKRLLMQRIERGR